MTSSRSALIIIFAFVYANGSIEHRYGPGDTSVRQGETATLHCAFNGQGNDRVFWYRLSTGTLLSQNEHVSQGSRPAIGRYVITGDHENGEYDLQIANAQRSDSDEYRCGFERGSDHIYLGARLRVMIPPNFNYPACLLMTERNEIGRMTKLSCISTGGDPPATLVWERDGVPITPTATKRNELDHVMGVEDVDATFTCIAESMAMHEVRSCSLQPLRRYPSVMVLPLIGHGTAGGSFAFECRKQDQQPDDTYVWYFNDNKVLPDSSSSRRFRLSGNKKHLTISDLTNEDNDAEIECKVDNGTAILVGTSATLSVTEFVVIENTNPPRVTVDRRLPITRHPLTGLDDGRYLAQPPNSKDNSKIALIAVSIIGGLAIASLAAIIYIYVQRKANKKPRQTTIPMTPRSSTRTLSSRLSSKSFNFSIRSFRHGSSTTKSCRGGQKIRHPDMSSPESYAALSMADKHNYQDLRSVASCSSFVSSNMIKSVASCSSFTSNHGNMVTACALPLPPISPSDGTTCALPLPPISSDGTSSYSMRVHSHPALNKTISTDLSEDAESNDSYETIDEKILKISKPNRTENNKDSGYLEILA
ncbi:uncharacterized protein [Amphiura filiformis]|uniref:uncharacterized protein n=1 Tax=Amphiura filiformis TaxID=82378 RepID=UPI003B225A4F